MSQTTKFSVFVGSSTKGKTSGNCTGNLIPFKDWQREVRLQLFKFPPFNMEATKSTIYVFG